MKKKVRNPLREIEKIENRRDAPLALIIFGIVFVFAASVVTFWVLLLAPHFHR